MPEEPNRHSESASRELAPPESVVSASVRHVDHPELRNLRREDWRGYLPAVLLVAVVALIVIYQQFQRPPQKEPGMLTTRLSSAENAQQAFRFAREADETFKNSKHWWNDDEDGIRRALNKYRAAWELLHGGAAYPDGKLTHDSVECRVLEEDLRVAIGRCNKDLK